MSTVRCLRALHLCWLTWPYPALPSPQPALIELQSALTSSAALAPLATGTFPSETTSLVSDPAAVDYTVETYSNQQNFGAVGCLASANFAAH